MKMKNCLRRIGNTIYLGLLLVVWALVGNAQVNNPSIISVTTAPSGTCAAGLPNQQVASTGVQYSCQNVTGGVGTWGAVGAGSGGAPTGTASGALTGSYPGPQLVSQYVPTLSSTQMAGTADSYATLQAAINTAIASNQELFIPSGTYKVSAGLNANTQNFRMRGAGSSQVGATTSITASSSGYTVLTIGPNTTPTSVDPSGYVQDIEFDGSGRPGSPTGNACVEVNGLNQFTVQRVACYNSDVGFTLMNDSFGTVFKDIRSGFGGNVNAAFYIPTGTQSGSDLSFYNLWASGIFCAVCVSGNGGGYHFYGGQLSATPASVNTLAGSVVIGYDYLTAATGGAEADFWGTSFEGTHNAWVFNDYTSNLITYGIDMNPAEGPAIGVFKGTDLQNAQIQFHDAAISGAWSNPQLFSVAGSYGSAINLNLVETNTVIAANAPTINGVQSFGNLVDSSGGLWTTMLGQSGLQGVSNINDKAGALVAGSRNLPAPAAASLFGQSVVAQTPAAPQWGNGNGFSAQNSIFMLGDSITVGVGTATNPYASLTGAYYPVFDTNSNSGNQSADVTWLYAFPNNTGSVGYIVPRTYNGNFVYTVLIGTNDANQDAATSGASTTGRQNNYYHSLMATATMLGIPDQYRINAQNSQSCTTTGTWTSVTVDGYPTLQSIVPGSTLSCTSLTSGDAAVYASWLANDATTSTATFKIDGAQVDTWNAFGYNGKTISTINGTTETFFANRYALSGGSHTYLVTVGTAGSGNPFNVAWIASPSSNTFTAFANPTRNPARVLIGGVLRQNSDASPTYTATYDALASSLVTQLSADGVLAQFVNVRNFVNSTTDMTGTNTTLANGVTCLASTSVGLHPNNCGHQHLADAFLATLQPSSAPGNIFNRALTLGQYPQFVWNQPTTSQGLFPINPTNVTTTATSMNPGLTFYDDGGTSYGIGLGFVNSGFATAIWGSGRVQLCPGVGELTSQASFAGCKFQFDSSSGFTATAPINAPSIGATTPGTGAFTSLTSNGSAVALAAVSAAITSATAGSGISAVTCTTAACTNLRGTYTMTATTVSAGATILTLVWPTTTTAYVCLVSQDGGTLAIAPSHSVATATGMAIVSDLAITSGSIGIDYSCQP